MMKVMFLYFVSGHSLDCTQGFFIFQIFKIILKWAKISRKLAKLVECTLEKIPKNSQKNIFKKRKNIVRFFKKWNLYDNTHLFLCDFHFSLMHQVNSIKISKLSFFVYSQDFISNTIFFG